MGFIQNALVNGNTTLYNYGRTMSFPSAFNKGGNQLELQGMKAVNLAKAQLLMAGGELVSGVANKLMGKEGSVEDEINDIKSVNVNLTSVLRQQMYNDSFVNYAKYKKYLLTSALPDQSGVVTTEDNEFRLPSNFLRTLNSYRFAYVHPVLGSIGNEKIDDNNSNHIISRTKVVPSIFNPKYGIQTVGIHTNVPLTNDPYIQRTTPDISDCSIRKLVRMSNTGELGSETYRLSDFMFCKDLGKVSNNHLITLRKFALPVPDHIGLGNGPKYRAQQNTEPGLNVAGDIAHMVTWFGTDDNKLEDIIKFSYEVEYIDKESKIQELDSKEDSPDRGPLGMAINTLSPMLGGNYFKYVNEGTAGTQNLWSMMLGSNLAKYSTARDASDQAGRYRNYDNNKVYEPMNTMREMSIPSGKLKFNHEFTLNFSYKLRAYENINPRSALTDLIGNILETTSNRGRWWGGQQKVIGPAPNGAAWKKAQAFIDNAWDKIGGVISAIAIGGEDVLQQILGRVGNILGETLQTASNVASELANGNWRSALGAFKQVSEKTGLGTFAKGWINNALGRPAFYAFDSLLTGEPTGVWHVTIGNPLAPIMTMGNLRITNTTFSMNGPLGIDGFPTEIKVSVTLKHCRTRDLCEISKMFANGLSNIYHSTAGSKLANYYVNSSGGSDSWVEPDIKEKPDSEEAKKKQQEAAKKNDAHADAIYARAVARAKEQLGNQDAELLNSSMAFTMWQVNDYIEPALRITIDEAA